VLTRVSGNEKLVRVDPATGARTQLTFGTHDDAAAQFLDADTLVFSSTAVDPNEPVDPEVAKNGTIFNLWTLNLKTGALLRYTDSVGGNLSPVVLNGGTDGTRVAFVSYYKGDYSVHVLDRKEPIGDPVTTEDFGSPGPIIGFQAPLTHTLVADNQKKKGKFEKLYLEGRPPVNVGLTSGGDFLGGTAVAFTDVLGDQQFSLYATSVSQYRSFSGSYINLERRFQYALQAFSQTQFFYGQLEGIFYDPSFSGIIDRDLAVATTTARGATAFGIWPFNRYRRVELSGGIVHSSERFEDVGLQEYSQQYQEQQFGRQLLNNGTMVPFGLAFIQETTIFREFGPLAGNTVRLSYEVAPKMGSTLSRQTVDLDARKYFRLGGSGLLALRAKGFKSWGDNPGYYYFGGNSEMRGYQYLEFVGQNAGHLNAELRIPLILAMATPVGILGGVRGTLFANVGGAAWANTGFKAFERDATIERPILDYTPTGPTTADPVFGPPVVVEGFRLLDARASYGIGLQTFALGFPIHFDWSWRTLFNKDWEDVKFAQQGGSAAFRKPRFQVWIGYDF
ncbi:MAG TPA: hypothetical protein VMW48_19255, partial [Vicinamibacterales bacterium]|nr:hypothetical protein [Vicinamibacterales bacterium]